MAPRARTGWTMSPVFDAVIAMTVMYGYSRRRMSRAVNPSMTGIRRSKKMPSGTAALTRSSASCPFAAVSTVKW